MNISIQNLCLYPDLFFYTAGMAESPGFSKAGIEPVNNAALWCGHQLPAWKLKHTKTPTVPATRLEEPKSTGRASFPVYQQ